MRNVNPPRKSPRVDENDVKLIDLLKYEGVLAPRYVEIARRVDMPVSTVRDRIRRLEKRGIIKTYTADLNRAKLGQGIRVIRLVRFKAAPNKVFEKYLAWGKTYPKWIKHIAWAVFTSGHYDAMLAYDFADMQEYHQFNRELMSFMGNYIEVEDLTVTFTAATEWAPKRTFEDFEKVLKRLIVRKPRRTI